MVIFVLDTSGLAPGLFITDTKPIKQFYYIIYSYICTELLEMMREEGKSVPNLEFEYKYDMASFLGQYSKILSLVGLERLTGVNQGQLSHYITGHRKPSRKTVEKIEISLRRLGGEICRVQFADYKERPESK